MSGKKRSEVIDVLQEAEKARTKTNDSLNTSINRDSEKVKKNQKELKVIQEELEENEELSKEARNMFGKDAEQQAKQCDKLLQELKQTKISDTFARTAAAQLKQLEEQLQECDKEAAAIRRAVATKPHYCDNEFKRAKQLKKRYEELTDKRKKLADDIKREAIVAGEKVSDARRIYNVLRNTQESVKNINFVAKNRAQANEWKETLKRTLKEIPLKEAQNFKKFDDNDFELLAQKVKSLISKDDNLVNEKAAELLNEINNYKAELVNKVQLWKKQKDDAEALFNRLSLTKDECFIDPVDYFQNGDSADQISLFEYLDKFVQTDYKDKFDKAVKNAENAMEHEDFIEAYKEYEKANEIVKVAKNKALSLQETMFKNLDIAQKIDDAMYSLGYDVETQIINDNPNDGFRILCSCGDEIIDFTRIVYDENGNPVVDIDHTESRTGTCGKSWEEIVKRMREQGLPIEAPRLANGEPIWHDHQSKKDTSQLPGSRKQI